MQLKKNELLRLAKRKNAHSINDNASKSYLVQVLSHFVNRADIDSLLPKGRAGKDAVIKGGQYEKKCMNHFVKKGYKCSLNYTEIEGMEFDIVGKKTEQKLFTSTEKTIVVECKNKSQVSIHDFTKFKGKYDHFIIKSGIKDPKNCRGFIITSGIFDPKVKNTARSHSQITLKRIP